jgi:hypothetical protein
VLTGFRTTRWHEMIARPVSDFGRMERRQPQSIVARPRLCVDLHGLKFLLSLRRASSMNEDPPQHRRRRNATAFNLSTRQVFCAHLIAAFSYSYSHKVVFNWAVAPHPSRDRPALLGELKKAGDTEQTQPSAGYRGLQHLVFSPGIVDLYPLVLTPSHQLSRRVNRGSHFGATGVILPNCVSRHGETRVNEDTAADRRPATTTRKPRKPSTAASVACRNNTPVSAVPRRSGSLLPSHPPKRCRRRRFLSTSRRKPRRRHPDR